MLTIDVTKDMQACFGDTVMHPLYSTASMVNHMEWASYQLIEPFLEEHETVVGHEVKVTHLKPTPIGKTIQIKSSITSIIDNHISCLIEAHGDNAQKIGEGTLIQVILPKNKIQKAYAPNNQPTNLIDSILSETQKTQQPSNLSMTEQQHTASAFLGITDTATQQYAKLGLSILGWAASPISICTRYDEWLTTKLEYRLIESNGKSTVAYSAEGAFLLRYELAELFDKLQESLSGTPETCHSDFLETPLQFDLTKEKDSNSWIISGTLNPCQAKKPQDFESTSTSGKALPFTGTVQHEALIDFCDQIEQTLNDFSSLL